LSQSLYNSQAPSHITPEQALNKLVGYYTKKPTAAEKKMRQSYCGEVENDGDSMVLDHIEEVVRQHEAHEHEVKSYQNRYVEEVEEEEERPKKPQKLSKRQEIINSRKQPRNSSIRGKETSVSRPETVSKERETRSRPQDSQVSFQPQRSQNKNEFFQSPKKSSLTHSRHFGNEEGRGGSRVQQSPSHY